MKSTADKDTVLAKLAVGVEGMTTFTSRPDSSYRFRLDAKRGKLRFWVEDRKTKQQWQTTELQMKDFVGKENVIPHATFDDYAVCFLDCLRSSLPSDDFERELVPSAAKWELWELRLTLKLRTFSSTWAPTYCFQLEPVPLEQVDLLAAQLRDQVNAIEGLQARVNELEAIHSGAPPYLRVTTTTNVTTGMTLVWTWRDGNQSVFEVETHGEIRIKIAGVFVVNASIPNYTNHNSTTVQLLVNGTIATSVEDSANNTHRHLTSLSYVLMAKADDKISVVYSGNGSAYANSSIVIYQLR